MITRKEAENYLGRKVKIKIRGLGKFTYKLEDIDENVIIFEKEIDGEKSQTFFY